MVTIFDILIFFLIGPSVLRAPAEQTKVATILGIFPLFLGPPLFKTTEGVVIGFQIFAWAPKFFFKNLGKFFF